MIALLQRVTQASVAVEGCEIARIEQGLLVLLGVEREDSQQKADKLLKKVLGYRVFEDDQGKMNHSLLDINGQLLAVPQFTLAANTNSGLRPSFSAAAVPVEAEMYFNYVVSQAKKSLQKVESGQFAANMQVSLLNNGPVTFWLKV